MRDCNESFFFGMATMAGLVLLFGLTVILTEKAASRIKPLPSQSDGQDGENGYIPEEECVPVNYANKSDGGDDRVPTDPCGYESGDAYHDL